MFLKGKKILLCISGSIAAYKSVLLLRMLVKKEAEVKVIMTDRAKDFISPLTFSTLSKNEVLDNLFTNDTWANHALLARWADVILIAPASCNTIAKMAAGLCDNLLLAVYLSAQCPVLLAPAMDEDMWLHEATKKNITTLRQRGNFIIPVNKGALASGLSGEGRMAEPEEIEAFLSDLLAAKSRLRNKKVLVSAGPTYELLDPVRFIGNRSSGKMGVAIAEEFFGQGAFVHLILGPSEVLVREGIDVQRVVSAEEMYHACLRDFSTYDIVVLAAAVADYAPQSKSSEKLKKNEKEFSLNLVRTRDILLKAGELKQDHQTLVGFALETHNEKDNALSKLRKKNADLIVLNSLRDEGAGFGYATNKITVFDRNEKEYDFPLKPKTEAAKDIVNIIIQYRNE